VRGTVTIKMLMVSAMILFSSQAFCRVMGTVDDSENQASAGIGFRRFGIGIQAGGPTLISSVQADCFLNRRINVEAGAGIFGFFGGLKYYFGKTDWTPYIGACAALIPQLFGTPHELTFYLPAGVMYRAKSGFMLAFETAVLVSDNLETPVHPFWGGLKVGYRF